MSNVKMGTRSLTPKSSPLLACIYVMSDSRDLEIRSQYIATLIVRAGTDLTLCNKEGSSACTLILQARGGCQYLQEVACQHIDFFMLQEMACVDSWLMAALARALPTFQNSVQ